MRYVVCTICLCFPLLVCTAQSFAKDTYYFPWRSSYDEYLLKTFKGDRYGEVFVLELARGEEPRLDLMMERIQIRNQKGYVVAYSPSRLTAVPFCFGLSSCWVFLWKTVYPLPAIYKLDNSRADWIETKKPPMRYSRVHPAGKGFENVTRFGFGVFGVLLLAKEKAWYFSVCIFLAIILCLQIARYHDLPPETKKWVRTIMNTVFVKTMLPIEPYMITSVLIVVLTYGVGIHIAGVPLVISVAVIMVTFLLCASRVARVRMKQHKE